MVELVETTAVVVVGQPRVVAQPRVVELVETTAVVVVGQPRVAAQPGWSSLPRVVELVETTAVVVVGQPRVAAQPGWSSLSRPLSTERQIALAWDLAAVDRGAMPFTYILKCADGSYYVGSTRGDLADRVHQHAIGTGSRYTACRRPVELVWFAEFERVTEAFALEKQVQNWSRAKREALIEGRFADLPGLSRSRGRRESDLDKLDQPGASAGVGDWSRQARPPGDHLDPAGG